MRSRHPPCHHGLDGVPAQQWVKFDKLQGCLPFCVGIIVPTARSGVGTQVCTRAKAVPWGQAPSIRPRSAQLDKLQVPQPALMERCATELKRDALTIKRQMCQPRGVSSNHRSVNASPASQATQTATGMFKRHSKKLNFRAKVMAGASVVAVSIVDNTIPSFFDQRGSARVVIRP
jgi:hypothetical protein